MAQDKRSSTLAESVTLVKTGNEIGEGSYGKVIEFKDESERLYAAKQLHNVSVVNSQYRTEKQFMEKYAEKFAKLRHPNIVEFCGISKSSEGSWLLVTEKMMGNLTSVLEKSHDTIKMEDKLTILLGVAEGLRYLHSEAKVVHGCLSSNNILLSKQNRLQIKIGDVGIASMLKRKPGTTNQHGGTSRSTADFLPPQGQIFKQKDSLSLDIFSYGAVILHTVTLKWPNPKQYESLLAKIKEERVEFEMLVKHCMDENHERRPQLVTVLETIKKLSDQTLPKSVENVTSESQVDLEERCRELALQHEALVDDNRRLKEAITEVTV